MWQVYTRRRRIRWLAIAFLFILGIWCFILYKSLSLNYEQGSPHVHPVWLAIAFLFILGIWCFILYKSLSLNYEQGSPHVHPVLTSPSASQFVYDIDNHDLFLQRTPVKSNYHIFYYPWWVCVVKIITQPEKWFRYGNPEFDSGRYYHWNHRRLAHWNREKAANYPQHRHEPPEDIGSNFYPWLGLYSSRSPTVLEKHMRMIRMSGAGQWRKERDLLRKTSLQEHWRSVGIHREWPMTKDIHGTIWYRLSSMPPSDTNWK